MPYNRISGLARYLYFLNQTKDNKMKKQILMMVFGAALMMACIPANAKSISDARRPEYRN